MDPDLSKALQVTVVDAPVAALAAPSVVADSPEDALQPEDKQVEQLLRRAHQAAAWVVKASTAASFF